MTPQQANNAPRRLLDRVWLRHGLFLVLALGLAGLLYWLGWNHYIAGSARNRQVQGVLKVAQGVEVLVLGNSNANCVDPGLLKPPTVRLNFNGADLFAADYQARCLRDRLPRLKAVLVSVSYFSFSWDNAALTDQQGNHPQADLRRWLYATYPCWAMIPGDYGNYLQGKLWGLLSHDNWESLLGRGLNLFPSLGPPVARAEDERGMEDAEARPPGSAGPAGRLAWHARVRSQAIEREMRGMLAQEPDLPQRTLQCLLGLSRFLKQGGVRPVYFTPPYYRDFSRAFDQGQQSLMRRSMARVVAETGAEYHDLSHDPAYVGQPGLFKNSDHLNDQGSRLFTAQLGRLVFAPRP